ncbi:MAG: hypothetical protein GY943_30350 [Chloroflexi bacterium]|nr:hypothetical protein [Chloroflexota bacterium]
MADESPSALGVSWYFLTNTLIMEARSPHLRTCDEAGDASHNINPTASNAAMTPAETPV